MSKKLQRRKQKGFTLVELSIVLVIIGLIISSVLVGQDLVRSAELRAVVTEYESFNAAVGTFRGKYNGLPGDIAGENDYGWDIDGTAETGAAAEGGNGDGLLDAPSATSFGATSENLYFWNHLGSTGAALISGSYDGGGGDGMLAADAPGDSLPATEVGEFWGVFTDAGTNFFIIGATSANADTNQSTAVVLNPLDARGIDEKIDDGRPFKGIVQARDGNTTNANTAASFNATAGIAACMTGANTPTGATYNTQQEGVECTLRIRFNL